MNSTHATRAIAFAALVTVAIVACKDSTAPDDFLPIISNTWHDVLDEAHTFSLSSNDDSTASGSFTGEEDHPTLGLSDLSGSFNHSQLSFTIHRFDGAIVYSGHFLQRDTMYVSSSEGALTLAR